MAGDEALPVIDEDVLVLTAKGKAELCAPGTSLSAAELELLVLADDRGSGAAGSGAELVGELHQPPVPDVVLLGAALPDVDGLKVLAKMRSHPVLKDVPVIVLAPDAARDRLLKALQSDVQGYFTEPFEVDDLLLAVKTVLGLPGTGAGAELTVDWGDDRRVPGAR